MTNPDYGSDTVSPREKGIASLKSILVKFHDAFSNDSELVKKSAAHHGIKITEGTMLEAPREGAYSVRIPTGSQEEVNALTGTPIVALACMDYRQVSEVYEQLNNPRIFIANAGGGAQPDKERQQVTADLLVAMYTVNSKIGIVLTGHIGVCGGANYFTNGEMKKIHDNQGVETEKTKMVGFLSSLKNKICEKGIPENQVRLGIAIVNENNDFPNLEMLSDS